jgi:hypothetical protein
MAQRLTDKLVKELPAPPSAGLFNAPGHVH